MAKYNQVHLVYERGALDPNEDVAINVVHIRKILDNVPDISDMDDFARDNFVSRVYSWWAPVKAHVSLKLTLQELRFYDVPSVAGTDMGDPVRIEPIGIPGTSSAQPLPPQVSMSVTFRTAKRLQWGRMYIPGLTVPVLSTSGAFGSTVCDEMATSTHLLTDRSGSGAALTIFSRKHWTHNDPVTIQVDDVPDVVRRRRFSATHHRASVSAG